MIVSVSLRWTREQKGNEQLFILGGEISKPAIIALIKRCMLGFITLVVFWLSAAVFAACFDALTVAQPTCSGLLDSPQPCSRSEYFYGCLNLWSCPLLLMYEPHHPLLPFVVGIVFGLIVASTFNCRMRRWLALST